MLNSYEKGANNTRSNKKHLESTGIGTLMRISVKIGIRNESEHAADDDDDDDDDDGDGDAKESTVDDNGDGSSIVCVCSAK